MQKNLVIVESPAKAKTIEKFLGKDYKVMSSYGHICDLKKKEFSINTNTFEPEYEIPEEKAKLVQSLRSEAKKADTVWLASDEDREGEAISWHLYTELGLQPEKTKRIVFHEITKNAILNAIENPRAIDTNLVYAQQARRVLDRIVGFKLSPVLWRKVKPALSAGRVQSVTVRLVVEREREINSFTSEPAFRVTAVFELTGGEEKRVLNTELSKRFKTKEEAEAFLESCKDATFVVDDINTKPLKKSPAAPFTTSTLQQEAARKLGFTVSQTMMVAQRLYESGYITYMRTDSVNLSSLCIGSCKGVITDTYGAEYLKSRNYSTSSKGAQEAHEAIRPTYMSNSTIEGTMPEKRLYELIWKRTIASQMADALVEKTIVEIATDKHEERFIATGEVTVFDGFLHVYRESSDEENGNDTAAIPAVRKGEQLKAVEIVATERFTQHPPRYTEASLVRKLEELGIGRPSTYAPTISTIQQRGYVEKGNKAGTSRKYSILTLKNNKITAKEGKESVGAEKGKLLPTDIGIVVNDFLLDFFPEIMDYNFTATVEKDFDEIADGKKPWVNLIKDFYADFEPQIEKIVQTKNEHKVGERVLGNDPASGKPVSVKIGRFGPIVQIGSASDEEKPRFAQMKPGQTLETITLEEALGLFSLPRTLGEFEGESVTVGAGRFGPYIKYGNAYVTLPKTFDPLTVSLEEAQTLIVEKRKAEAERIIKTFDNEPALQVLNGRFGPYIAYDGSNYKLPKNVTPAELSLEECLDIVKKQQEGGKAPAKGRRYTKKR
ncbi:MAG: type I DNA topoisomerase [Bacteroidaceae bacterium]|nr:type I DNA topoisomerase [Bacteroidales bacterium]MBO5262809.1 type I DNA topoisomerase [Bacteroidaceae bacterium]MBQ8257117.1 type I DNA topoisomerase [Bacteroidaceae bacterium]